MCYTVSDRDVTSYFQTVAIFCSVMLFLHSKLAIYHLLARQWLFLSCDLFARFCCYFCINLSTSCCNHSALFVPHSNVQSCRTPKARNNTFSGMQSLSTILFTSFFTPMPTHLTFIFPQ